MPGHFGVEVEGEGVGVEAFGEEGGADDVGAGEGGQGGEADGIVVERGAEGGAAAELPEAAEEPLAPWNCWSRSGRGLRPCMMSAMRTWVGSTCLEMRAGSGLFCQAIRNQRRRGGRLRSADLDELGGGADGDVAAGSAFLKDFHVVEGGVAVEVVLMAVEAGGEVGEVGVAGIDPAGAGEAVPVALGDDVGVGVEGGEVGGNDAVVAGEDGGDAEGAEAGDEAFGGGRALVQEVEGDGFDEAAHVAHELPVLVGGLGDPVADGEVGVAGVAEGLVEDEVGAALDEDGVGAGEGEDVDFVLPAGVGPVGRGVAVGVFVEGVADFVEGGFGDGRGGRGEDEVGGAELKAVGGDLEVGGVFEVPVDAVEEGGEGGGVDVDVAGGAGDGKASGWLGWRVRWNCGARWGMRRWRTASAGAVGIGRRLRLEREEQERGAAEEPERKHVNTISPGKLLGRW